jgi:glucosamine--fructose-6-phosphate aminotransferase (isomerizing)
MAQAAAHVLPLRTGVEASVAATKTYTASLGVLAALAAAIAADRGLELELDAMPDAIARQLRHADVDAAIAAGTTWQRLAVLGRGANYATAFEAALKVKELTGVAAEPASPADFMHGPIAIVDRGFPVLAVAASGPALPGMVETLDAARARGGRVVAIAEPASRVTRDGDVLVELERVPEWLSPMVAVVPAQLLAVGLAERLGHDPDRPFGLSKVTRTT